MKLYIERLLLEWMEHKKIIIAVDFDDTLCNYNLNNFKDQQKVYKTLKKAQKLGCYTVIFTAREPHLHNEVINYCNKIDLKIDSINVNPIPLPFGNNGKIYYNINLCDRSGLREALKILNKTIKKYEKWLK